MSWYIIKTRQNQGQAEIQGQFFSAVQLVSIESFYFFQTTKVKEYMMPYYLPIAGAKIIGFILFPRIWELYEIQTVSFKIWNRFTLSVSLDDNPYLTSIFTGDKKYLIMFVLMMQSFIRNKKYLECLL